MSDNNEDELQHSIDSIDEKVDGLYRWTDVNIDRIQSGIHLRRPHNYQSLFKYVSLSSPDSWEYLHKTLHNAALIGSPPAALNDPFEVRPYVFDDLQPGTIADAVRRFGLRWNNRRRRELPPTRVELRDAESCRKQASLNLDQVLDRYRIIGFCERVDSSLLWSHYANSYRGACLHFLAGGFSRDYDLGHVSYSKYRPAYPLSLALELSLNPTPIRVAESNKILFFTKADDWAYEAEIRLVYDTKLFPAALFREGRLVSIILGPRFEKRQQLDGILKGSPCENIPVKKARLSHTTFSIEIDE